MIFSKLILLFRFVKSLLTKKNKIILNNLSTVSEEQNVTTEENIKTESLVFTCYLYNINSKSLSKANIELNYTLIEILDITPWGVIALNQEAEIVNLKFLPPDTYLMNTVDFPCKISQGEISLTISPLSKIYDLKSAKNHYFLGKVSIIKNKKIKYPLFDEKFISKNKQFLNQTQILDLLSPVSTPVSSLEVSLDVLDEHLKSHTRIFGNRWSMGSKIYYSESKLSQLDKMDIAGLSNFTNNTNYSWSLGEVAVICLDNQKMLIEVLSQNKDSLFVIDRIKACNLLKSGMDKHQTLLACQSKININDIKNIIIFNN